MGMKVTVGSEIRIQHPTPELVAWVREELVMPNPEYSKKLRMGLWVGKTPAQISMYRVDGDSLYLPCGAGKGIRPFLTADTLIVQDLADNGLFRLPGYNPPV